MTAYDYQNELQDLKDDLSRVQAMTEKEACIAFNVDCKAEIIQILNEGIEACEEELYGVAETDPEDSVTEIFGSYEAMNRQFI